jgi:hypothetical protein
MPLRPAALALFFRRMRATPPGIGAIRLHDALLFMRDISCNSGLEICADIA